MSLLFLMACENEDDKTYMTNLYLRYYPLMRQRAYAILNDYKMVDDLIQEAFLKIIPKISLLRSLTCYKETSYIVNTIKHVCLDYQRRERRRYRSIYTGLDDDVANQIPDMQAATEENYLQQEEVEIIEKAMLCLSERDRSLLYFKYNMEMSDKEIAPLLNIPAQHIRQYAGRARRRLFEILSEGEDYHVQKK